MKKYGRLVLNVVALSMFIEDIAIIVEKITLRIIKKINYANQIS